MTSGYVCTSCGAACAAARVLTLLESARAAR